MNKREKQSELTGPWRKLHSAVWIFGLAILFWQGWWWPGILVLVGISIVLEALLMQVAPQTSDSAASPGPAGTQTPPATPSTPAYRADLLPSNCDRCGAPIKSEGIKWTGAKTAECAYCGARIEMKKE